MRRALFYLPLLLPQRYAGDRDNFRHAWAYAVEHGLAHELAEMAGGMVILSITQGIQSAGITGEALQAVRQYRVPETDRSMLHLLLVDLVPARWSMILPSCRNGTRNSQQF